MSAVRLRRVLLKGGIPAYEVMPRGDAPRGYVLRQRDRLWAAIPPSVNGERRPARWDFRKRADAVAWLLQDGKEG